MTKKGLSKCPLDGLSKRINVLKTAYSVLISTYIDGDTFFTHIKSSALGASVNETLRMANENWKCSNLKIEPILLITKSISVYLKTRWRLYSFSCYRRCSIEVSSYSRYPPIQDIIIDHSMTIANCSSNL